MTNYTAGDWLSSFETMAPESSEPTKIHEHSAVHVTVGITLTSYVHAIMIFIEESVFSTAFIGATVNIQNHCSRL